MGEGGAGLALWAGVLNTPCFLLANPVPLSCEGPGHAGPAALVPSHSSRC